MLVIRTFLIEQVRYILALSSDNAPSERLPCQHTQICFRIAPKLSPFHGVGFIALQDSLEGPKTLFMSYQQTILGSRGSPATGSASESRVATFGADSR